MKTRNKRLIIVIFSISIMSIFLTSVSAGSKSGGIGPPGGTYFCETTLSSAKTSISPPSGYHAIASITATYTFANPNPPFNTLQGIKTGSNGGPGVGISATITVTAASARLMNPSIPTNWPAVYGGSVHTGSIKLGSDTHTLNISTNSN